MPKTPSNEKSILWAAPQLPSWPESRIQEKAAAGTQQVAQSSTKLMWLHLMIRGIYFYNIKRVQ